MRHTSELELPASLRLPSLPALAESRKDDDPSTQACNFSVPYLPGVRAQAADDAGGLADPLGAFAEFCAALDSLEEGLLLVDNTGSIWFSNGFGEDMARGSRSRRPQSLFEVEADEPWSSACDLLRQVGHTRSPMSTEVRDATGKTWLISLRGLPGSHSDSQHWLLQLRDTTSLVDMREALRLNEALARTGLLLAGAAHQTKNVLFGLSATLEAFEAHNSRVLGQDPHLRQLRDGIDRMQAIVRNLLEYSRPNAQRLSETSAATVIREAAFSCRRLADECSVALELDLASDIPLRGDTTALIRALDNVIDNAVRHSPAGSPVRIAARRMEGVADRLLCTVSDEGPGFPSRNLDHFFEPFVSRRPGGTGIGLTIARKIILDHGGEIRLGNSSTGGAVVTIVLPVAQGSSQQLYGAGKATS